MPDQNIPSALRPVTPIVTSAGYVTKIIFDEKLIQVNVLWYVAKILNWMENLYHPVWGQNAESSRRGTNSYKF